MKKTIVLSLVLILAGSLVLTGCGEEKVAEELTEKAIEDSTNGSAGVDVENDSVTVNTNGSSFSAGESVSLPSGFPSDVHVIDGTVKAATTITEGEVYSVSVQTDTSVSDVADEYQEELANDGWDINMSLDIEGISSMTAEKDNRTVTVSIGEDEDEGKTLVTIGTSIHE
ncbi:MAG: hypothetical protein U5L76_03535 [Patescibacteria group bacterium]|nr:hypothetical protein [Patescibacteria group bacterium]